MRLSLAGFRHHAVLLAGASFPELFARLTPFFDVEVAAGVDLVDLERLRTSLAGKSALLDAQRIAIDAPMLVTLPHLKAICRIGPSDVGLDLASCTRAGVVVTNTPDVGSGRRARREMALVAADNLIAAFGFGRAGGHPRNLVNTELRCTTLGCCL